MARGAPGGGDQLSIDHQQAVVVAGDVGLHDHRARVLARGFKAFAHFVVGGQVDADAAAVVAVVGLGNHSATQLARGAHRAAVVDHQLLARHRQPQQGEDLVGLLLVTGELHRYMRGAAGHRGLDALLETAMAQLDQRPLVEAQPGDAALLGRAHQCSGGRTQRAALRVQDELVAGAVPVPVGGHAVLGLQLDRQQRGQQLQRQFASGDALLFLHVLVHHRVHTGSVLAHAAGLAEGHVLAGHVLQFDGDVLQHMPQPGAFAFAHAADEPAWLAVGAAVLGQAGQCGDQVVDEALAQASGRPGLQHLQVELQPNDREVCVVRGADVDGTFEDAHA